jgi:hypothetical protein
MSQSAVSITDAPRDLEKLQALGRFNLRRLAEELGVFKDEATKGAFMNGTNPQMGQAVYEALVKFDAESGKASAPAAAKRTPVTNGKTSKPKETETPAASTPSAAPAAGIQELLGAINGLKDAIGELAERLENVEGYQETTNAMVSGTNRLLVTQLVLNLMLAEEVMKGGPGRRDVLEAAISDTEGVITTLRELDPDLVPDAAEAEEEEETETGN